VSGGLDRLRALWFARAAAAILLLGFP